MAIAGHDPADSTSLIDPVPNYLELTVPSAVRIGVDWQYVSSGVDAEIVQLIERACADFTELGAQIVDVELPPEYRRLVDDWGVTCGVECAAAHADYYPARRSEYGPVLANLIDLALSLPPQIYQELQQLRSRFTSALDDLFLDRMDVLLAPSMTCLPPSVELMDSGGFEDADRAPFINFTAPFDYSGHPTLSLPAGLSGDGRPQGFQLVGKHLDEATLLAVGAAYERAVEPIKHPELQPNG